MNQSAVVMGPIVRGVVVELSDGMAKVSVVLGEETPAGMSRFVLIRADHHYSPKLHPGKYKVEFAERSEPRQVKIHDAILLRRHEKYPDLAWAWCYENDIIVTPGVLMGTKKIPYAVKVQQRRAAEMAIAS